MQKGVLKEFKGQAKESIDNINPKPKKASLQ
jgi:hypothetical protein